MKIIAIETSCDETSIALLENKKVIDCLTWTQIDVFQNWGGVVPQIASQIHSVKLPLLLKKLIEKNKIDWKEIDLIAYTKEPGLVGCLKIGEALAKTIALYHNIPFLGVNHLYAHLYVVNLDQKIEFPALGLLVSGGHTQLIYMKKALNFQIIGTTLDDAIGETIDKIGRKLSLTYPAGAKIEKLARGGTKKYQFKIYHKHQNHNFSFSGLKTNAINLIQKIGKENIDLKDFTYSLQETIFDNIQKTVISVMKKYKVKNIVIGGGVAANKCLQSKIKSINIPTLIPKKKYCTDNAVMIGILAFYQKKQT